MIDYDYITNRPSPVVPTNAKAEIQAAFAFVTYLRNRHACLKDAQMFSRDSQVLFVDGQELLASQVFSDWFNGESGLDYSIFNKVRSTALHLLSDHLPVVKGLMFAAGYRELINQQGMLWLNSWRSPVLHHSDAELQAVDLSLFDQLEEMIFPVPEERMYWQSIIAHLVQCPEERVPVGTILCGAGGTGKSFYFTGVLSKILKTQVSTSVCWGERSIAYSWANCLLMVFDDPCNLTKDTLMRLTSLVSQPEVKGEAKYLPSVMYSLFCHTVLLINPENHADMQLPKDDRRWFIPEEVSYPIRFAPDDGHRLTVQECQREVSDFIQDYLNQREQVGPELWDEAILYRYLHMAYNKQALFRGAPLTDYKRSWIEGGKTDLQLFVDDQLEEFGNPAVVLPGWIKEHMQDGDRFTEEQIRGVLRERGYVAAKEAVRYVDHEGVTRRCRCWINKKRLSLDGVSVTKQVRNELTRMDNLIYGTCNKTDAANDPPDDDTQSFIF